MSVEKGNFISGRAEHSDWEIFTRSHSRIVSARTVDEYSPRAIISASPQAQRLDSKLVESIRRTNREFDALRRRVDATTDSASELSTFKNGIGMQTGQNYSALEFRYILTDERRINTGEKILKK